MAYHIYLHRHTSVPPPRARGSPQIIAPAAAFVYLAAGREKIADVVGGFHLRSGSDEEMRPVLSYFEKAAPHKIHACRCACFATRAALAAKFETEELGSGSVLEFK